ARLPRAGRLLAALGRRTLPVYVLHLPLVALVHLGSSGLVAGRVGGALVLATVYPVVVTALVLLVSLALHRVLVASGAWWLFEAPWLGRTRAALRDGALVTVPRAGAPRDDVPGPRPAG
ncbi:MAG: D-alanine--D-alanine ligase, partial [Nocardioides sp.]|nr:D-alanine--D-alanine ligase [Nocardioides sp.]